MDFSQFTADIANYGFPMVLSGYLLVRIEKKLEDLTKGINELGESIRALAKK